MPDSYITGLPGVRAARTATHRVVFRQIFNEGYLAGGKVIDGAKSRDAGNTGDIDVLRPGTLMGKITASGKYAPSILGVTTAAYTSGGTSVTVSAAAATELARRIGTSGTGTFNVIGPPSANGTVAVVAADHSAINTTTGVITVSSLGANMVAGSFITPVDGSETILSFIPDGWGVKVTDADGTSIDVQYPLVPVAGIIFSSQLLPAWPSDTSLQSRIVAQLNAAAGGQYVFDHRY